jgi:basic membrane protein A
MMKKVLALVLVLMLVFALGACGGAAPAPTSDVSVTMITDTGGLGDQSFNDSAWAGLEKAKAEFGVATNVLESQTADDYTANLSASAAENPALIISVGFLMAEATGAAAAQFPDQKFAIIDSTVDAPNVTGLTFKEHEGSFLVGVIAGITTKTNKVGFVGGMQFPLIEKFEYGFKAGVKSVNPAAEVLVNYTGVFDNPALGKEAALAQAQQGADVVFHASGACGIGVIEAAGEQGFWAIGVDMDQSALNPKAVLCSMVKRVDNATYLVTKSVVDGTFDGKNIEFGLAVDGVGYSDDAGNVPAEVAAKADAYKAAIIDGTIMVPADKAAFDAFVPTVL